MKNPVPSTQQQTSPDAILVVGENSRIVSYNRQFLDMWGIPDEMARAGLDEPVLRTAVSQMCDPDEFLAKVRYRHEHREQKTHDELYTKDGRIVERHSSPVVGAGGQYFGHVWYFRDISERKRAELALQESEARFRAVLEQSIAAIYVIQDGQIVYVNPRMREIFGYGPDEPFNPDPLAHVQRPERARVADQLRLQLQDETEAAYTITAIRKDGIEFTLGVHAKRASFSGRRAIIAVAQDITEKARAEARIQHYIAQLEKATQSTVNVVAAIGELRGPYTHGHERRVAELAAAIGTEMGLPADRVEGLRVAGYLHDVGNISAPAEILSKSTRLCRAEFELVKHHARQGYEILKSMASPWPVAEVARQHHERLDGSGYPRGLEGDAIIVEARIMAVADVVEAMSSHRPYRPGLGIDAGLAEIEKGRGRTYDAQAAEACLRLFRDKTFKLAA